MSDIVIGVCGKAGAGKDTVGSIIAADYGFDVDSLAAPLRSCVCDTFGIDMYDMQDREFKERELKDWPGWTPRQLMQVIGTDLFREQLQADVWVRSFILRMHGSVVVTDIRFPDEVHRIRERMGDNCLFIKVLRDMPDGAPGGVEGHVSEAHDLDCDLEVDNNGSMMDLTDKLTDFLDPYLEKKVKDGWNCTHPNRFKRYHSSLGDRLCYLCNRKVASMAHYVKTYPVDLTVPSL